VGTPRVGLEADAAEREAPGPQPQERLRAQDPGQEAPRRHRRGNAEAAKRLLPETVGEIDKAAKKGVVHDNAASRYKSRLSRKVTALGAAK